MQPQKLNSGHKAIISYCFGNTYGAEVVWSYTCLSIQTMTSMVHTLCNCLAPFAMCSEPTDKGNSAMTGTICSVFPFLWSRKEEPRHRPSPSWQHSSNKIQRLERESIPCLCAGIVSLAYAQGIAFPWTPKFSYHESRVILMNKKGIRLLSRNETKI